MKSTELRQIIRESINEYIREIDEAGNVAALEAKMNKTQEAIELREKKMNMDDLDEAYHDMLDKGKMKELSNEVKALKKSLTKYEKQLEKLKSKGSKVEKPEKKEIVDESDLDETFPESGAQLEENENDNLNSMSDYELMSHAEDEGMEDMIVRDGEGGLANREEIIAALSEGNNLSSTNQIYERLLLQKRAGIITESQYISKLAEVRKLSKKKTLVENQVEEGMVVDVALGVAGGLVGLWALIKGGTAVLNTLGDTAGAIADKMEAKAKQAAAIAKKEGRLETIKPIIAKFENDEELKNMYKALPVKDNKFGAKNKERNRQMTAIAKYIKSKLNDEEIKYFTDISAMLRTGDIA